MKYSKVKSVNYNMLIILLSVISINSYAKNNNSAEIEYKCHVELLGGQQTIHFISSTEKNPKDIERSLVGKKVVTIISKVKMKIYKVVECTNLYNDFKEKASKALDEEVPR